MNQILSWIIPVIIVVAVSFSFVGLLVATIQIIIKKLKKKDE
tara:strand:- start:246 stop:371 length:126 start_codon:yes stop_codon:yes gene_type:complete